MKIEFISQRRETLLLALAVIVMRCRITEKIQCFKEDSLRTADAFPVVASLPPTGDACAVRRLQRRRQMAKAPFCYSFDDIYD